MLNVHTKLVLGTSQRDSIYFVYNELLRKFTTWVSNNYMVRFPKQLVIALGPSDIKVMFRQSRNEEAFGIKHKDERTVFGRQETYSMDLNRGLHTFFMY